jgi:hypothetical protein
LDRKSIWSDWANSNRRSTGFLRAAAPSSFAKPAVQGSTQPAATTCSARTQK